MEGLGVCWDGTPMLRLKRPTAEALSYEHAMVTGSLGSERMCQEPGALDLLTADAVLPDPKGEIPERTRNQQVGNGCNTKAKDILAQQVLLASATLGESPYSAVSKGGNYSRRKYACKAAKNCNAEPVAEVTE
jgi:hypothetical protein